LIRAPLLPVALVLAAEPLPVPVALPPPAGEVPDAAAGNRVTPVGTFPTPAEAEAPDPTRPPSACCYEVKSACHDLKKIEKSTYADISLESLSSLLEGCEGVGAGCRSVDGANHACFAMRCRKKLLAEEPDCYLNG
jgi:hypothetical protein